MMPDWKESAPPGGADDGGYKAFIAPKQGAKRLFCNIVFSDGEEDDFFYINLLRTKISKDHKRITLFMTSHVIYIYGENLYELRQLIQQRRVEAIFQNDGENLPKSQDCALIIRIEFEIPTRDSAF